MQALDPTSVYTLAASFIESCPKSNAALPFKPYPTLSVDMETQKMYSRGISITLGGHKESMPEPADLPSAGEKVKLTAEKSIPADSYVTFVSGLSVVSVKAETDGERSCFYNLESMDTDSCAGNTTSAAIPEVAEGQTYVFVTSKEVEDKLDNSAILFGPAILGVAPQPPTYNEKQQ